MLISRIKQNIHSPMFGAAKISINAFSDTHGNLADANKALEELRDRQEDIFCKNKKGNYNVLAVVGDWFMDGARQGYSSEPDKPLAFFQLDILNEFISQIKNIAQNTLSLFTPGNHEFDSGVDLLDKVLSETDAEILMTNLDIDKSGAFKRSISGDKIINEKILEVEDDKNPHLKHKILFLGVSPVNMLSYQRNLDGVVFKDNIDKTQNSVQKNDYEKTLNDCKNKILKFKKDNPKGVVVLLSHTGVKFAENLIRESSVDLVFDAHEHREKVRHVKKVPIIPLSQNFKKLANAKIMFDDDGNKQPIDYCEFSPLKNSKKGPLFKLYNKLFGNDLKKRYSIKTDNPYIHELSIENIRKGNNFLANFITDSVLEEIRKTHPETDFFALNSSAIRHSLKVTQEAEISNFDVLNTLTGIRSDEAQIFLTEVTGKELTLLVLRNLLFNEKSPNQNSLVQYSGLIIDRTRLLEDYKAGKKANLNQYIYEAKTNKPIDPNKTYTIANVEKYFEKYSNAQIKAMKNHSKRIGKTVQELFIQHFKQSDGNLIAKCDVRIK